MSVNDNARIIFDEPTATFRPGQTITGRVVILTRNPMKISSVTIQFRGKCKITLKNWAGRKIGRQDYLKNEIALFCDKGKSQLEVGKYIYPFDFFLPHSIPSTFFCKYGYICYIAKVTIVIPRRSDVIKKLMFVVVSPIYLNIIPSSSVPQTALKEKSYSFGCFLYCSLKLVAYIPYSGFVPGQIIPVKIKLDNNTNVNIDYVIIRLERCWEIKGGMTQFKKSDIAYQIINGTKKHTSKTCVVQIKIPNSLMILNFKYCNVITDTFTIYVEALGHAKVSIKVILGNIPLATTSGDHQDNNHSIQKYCSYKSIPTNSFPFVD